MPLQRSRARRTAAGGTAVPAMPASIGGYRILGLLGQGGMGVVWEAEQQHPRRRVALKVMRQGHYVDDLHARMFHREAEILGRLKHPNIAAIYESGHTDDGHDFFAMELVRGVDARRVARQAPAGRDAGRSSSCGCGSSGRSARRSATPTSAA